MTGRTQLMENRSERPKFEKSETVVGVCFQLRSCRAGDRLLAGARRPEGVIRAWPLR